MKRKVLFIVVILILTACTAKASGPDQSQNSVGLFNNNPSDVSKIAFENYIKSVSVPYRDPKFSLVSNDGTYANVLITVEFRPSANSEWIEHEATVECRKVGNEWQCDQFMQFNLSKKTISRTEEAVARAKQELANERNSINVNFKNIHLEGNNILAVYDVTNGGKQPHKFAVQFSFDCKCTKGNDSKTFTGTSVYIGSGGRIPSKEISLNPNEARTITEVINYFDGYSVETFKNDCDKFEVSNVRWEISCIGCGEKIYWLDN